MLKTVFILVLMTSDGASAVIPHEFETVEQCKEAIVNAKKEHIRYMGYICIGIPQTKD